MTGLTDHCFIQRESDNRGRLTVELPSSFDRSKLSIAIKDRDSLALTDIPVAFPESRPGSEGAGWLTLGLPTGGPYSVAIFSGDHPIASAGHLLVGDLWVLAGQSNMQGLGEKVAGLPTVELSTMLSFDRSWKPAVEPLHRFWETKESAQYKMSPYLGFEITAEELDRQYEEIHPLDTADPVGGIGPGLFFAEELIRICGVPIGLIPCALGGSSLEMWQRDFAEKKNEPFPNTLYGDLVGRVRIAGGAVRGILWYQGESDTLPDNSKTYLERFEGFIRDLRGDLRLPHLPVITVQLATAEEMEWAGEENWDRVREAQRLGSETIPQVEMVASADLPRNDHVHISTDGHRALGKRLARAASTLTTGCAPQYSIPRLRGVRVVEGRIEVRFAGVNGSLALSPGASLKDCFEVPGSGVTEARISGPDRVEVTTDRSSAEAREIYYGRGFRPPLGLIDEAGFAMPLFGPVPIAK